MAVKHIVVYVDNDRACEKRLALAAQLASRHQAHLTAVYVRRQFIVPAYAGVHIPTEVLEENERISDELARSAESKVLEHFHGSAVACDWQRVEGRLPHVFSQWARCADLAVLAQFDPQDEGLNDNYRPDSVLLDSGTPAVVVPHTGEHAPPHKHALIAWDGGREAARALRCALPLLAEIERITVFNVDDMPGGVLDGRQIGEQLARHGLHAAFKQEPRGHLSAGDQLLAYAGDEQVDLIVMGAYGHSRLRETVLGGMTRHVLLHMSVPVLMAH